MENRNINERRMLSSYDIHHILVPCTSDQNLGNLPSYLTSLSYSISDPQTVDLQEGNICLQDGEFYDINIQVLGDSEHESCQLQNLLITGMECIHNVNVQGIDIDQAFLTYMNIRLNELESMKMQKANKITVKNIEIDRGGQGFFGEFKEIQQLDFDNIQLFNLESQDQNQQNYIVFDGIQRLNLVELQLSKCQKIQPVLISNTNNVDIIQGKFKDNKNELADKQGVVMLSNCQGIYMEQCEFYQNESKDFGGGLFLTEVKNVHVKDSEFIKNKAQKGGGAIQILLASNVTFYNIDCNENKGMEENGGCLHAENSMGVNIIGSRFEGNMGLNGGAIYITLVRLMSIQNSVFKLNDALEVGNGVGGVLYGLNDRGFLVQDSVFEQNVCGSNGGVFNFQLSEGIQFRNLSANGNSAFRGAVIETLSCKSMNIVQLKAQGNRAVLWGGVLSILNNLNDVIVEQQEYRDNYGGFYAGGIIFAYNSFGNVYVKDSYFKNNTAQSLGGVIFDYFTGFSQVKNCTFEENQSLQGYGGDIDSKLGNNTQILDCIFKYSKSINGASIALESLGESILINNSQFIAKNAKESKVSIYAYRPEKLEIKNSVLKEESDDQEQKIGGIYIVDSNQVEFDNVTFYRHFSQYGGGVSSSNGKKFWLQNCIFEGHGSMFEGGSLYVKNIDDFRMDGVQILESQSNGQGGGMYIENVQQFQVVNQFRIGDCWTKDKDLMAVGGGIYFKDVQKIVIQDGEIFGNYADYCGGGVAVIGNSELMVKNVRFYNNSVKFLPEFPQHEKLYDYQLSSGGGLYIESEQGKKEDITFIGLKFQQNMGSSGGGVMIYQSMESVIRFIQYEGVKYSGNQADIGPGLRYLGDENNILKTQVQELSSQQSNKGLIYEETFQFDYKYNERRVSNDSIKFDLCPQGTELMQGGLQVCNRCILNGECKGGYVYTYPKQGFWRFTKQDEIFIRCNIRPDSCLGNDTCIEGYEGILCEQCDYKGGYYRSADSDCEKCPGEGTVVLYQALFGIIFIVFITYISHKTVESLEIKVIKKTLKSLWSKFVFTDFRAPAVFKVIIGHFQLLYMLNSYNFKMPKFVTSIAYIISSPGEMISYYSACRSDRILNGSDLVGSQFRQIYIWNGILICICLLSTGCITRIYKWKQKFSQKYIPQILVSTFLIAMLTIQPSLIKLSILSFFCRGIGDREFSTWNSSISCESDFFKGVIVGYGMIYMFFGAFLFPASIFVYFLLHRKKIKSEEYRSKNLQNFGVLRVFGYVFYQYKKELFFWEIIQILSNYLILFFIGYFYLNQVLMLVLPVMVMLINMKLCYQFQPYPTRKLNQYNIISQGIVMFTVILNTFYVNMDQEEDEGFRDVVDLLVILLHIGFVLGSIYILFPFIGLYFKGVLIKLSEKYQFSFLLKRYHNKLQRKEQTQKYWTLLRLNTMKYNNILLNPFIQKLRPDILFYNLESEQLLEQFQQDNYQAIEKSESIILKQSQDLRQKNSSILDRIKVNKSKNTILVNNDMISNADMSELQELQDDEDKSDDISYIAQQFANSAHQTQRDASARYLEKVLNSKNF